MAESPGGDRAGGDERLGAVPKRAETPEAVLEEEGRGWSRPNSNATH
ncbi:MAG TPA: hypothetical protein G4O00_11115 [Thermoflexia bacterium]|nr:hypothetical protein [Thermoflexia bacterium]